MDTIIYKDTFISDILKIDKNILYKDIFVYKVITKCQKIL